MLLPPWRHGGKPVALPPFHRQVYKLYTPTIDGYERFLREMVGLDGSTPERRQRLVKRNHERRQAR
jgi:hypothetical protein